MTPNENETLGKTWNYPTDKPDNFDFGISICILELINK